VEGTNLYWAPGMKCRREPWCVTKIVKTTLQVLKPSKLSVVTLKTLLVNFARLGWRDAPGGAPEAHSILGPRGGNSEKISEVTFSSFFFFSEIWPRMRAVQSERGQARVCFAPLPRALATRPEPLQVKSWLARSVAGLPGRIALLLPGPKP